MLRWSLLLFIVALIVGFFGLGRGASLTNEIVFALFVAALSTFLLLDIATSRSRGIEAFRHTWSRPARPVRTRR